MNHAYPQTTKDKKTCFDLKAIMTDTTKSDSYFWNLMACQQFIMPQNTNGVTDMFYPDPADQAGDAARCKEKWGVTSQPNWTLDYYGGWNPSADFKDATNIIFSNGSQDPWHIGGIMNQYWDADASGVVYVFIKDGAHHYDLRANNDADTQAVKDARTTETKYIKRYIKEYNDARDAKTAQE